jgi:hypothetical protein
MVFPRARMSEDARENSRGWRQSFFRRSQCRGRGPGRAPLGRGRRDAGGVYRPMSPSPRWARTAFLRVWGQRGGGRTKEDARTFQDLERAHHRRLPCGLGDGLRRMGC